MYMSGRKGKSFVVHRNSTNRSRYSAVTSLQRSQPAFDQVSYKWRPAAAWDKAEWTVSGQCGVASLGRESLRLPAEKSCSPRESLCIGQSPSLD